jgi:hypothetical protein
MENRSESSKILVAMTTLFSAVDELERLFPGRPFTPDGHLVGSIGECLVATAYGLELMPPSNKGFDAQDRFGRKMEIKATFRDAVGFRSEPDFCIVVKLDKQGNFEEMYNGPGNLVWKQFEEKNLPSNGQYRISLSKLRGLQELVDKADRIPRAAS